MNIEVFVICDAASESGGKLYIMGVFDKITANQLPAKHPACTILVKLRFKQPEEGEHKISVELSDDKGEFLIPKFEKPFQVKTGEEGYASNNFIINIQNMIIKRYGENTVKLIIDGKFVTSTPLFVERGPQEKK